MRFETNDIVIEAGEACILIYPRSGNASVVWQGAPAGCKQAGRGLRVDMAGAPKLEMRLEAGQEAPDPASVKTWAIGVFVAAEVAYWSGVLTVKSGEEDVE